MTLNQEQALNPCFHLEVPQKHLKPLEPQLEGLLNLSLTLTQIESIHFWCRQIFFFKCQIGQIGQFHI